MSRLKSWCRVAAAVATVVAPTIALTARADAVPVVTGECGMVIQQSMILANDLSCDGNAMFVSQDSSNRLVVDLGGHTVWTTGVGHADESTVGITGGPVFGTGPITLRNGRVGGPRAADTGLGPITYKDLVFDGGVVATDQHWIGHVTIKGSTFVHGASVATNRTTVDIEKSSFVGDGSAPVAISLTSSSATVRRNTINGYGTGIATGGSGASIDIERNRVIGNDVGMRLSFDAPASGVVDANTVSRSRADGIVVGVGTDLTVSNNVTSSNGHDGIRVDPTPSTSATLHLTITGNSALFNADWGIESTPDAPPDIVIVDGGGNTAKHNAGGQCLYVACTQ